MEYRMRVKYWDGAAFFWSATPAFSKVSKISWTPTVARDYTVYIYGREIGMDANYSVYKEIPYTVLTTAHAGPLGIELGTAGDYTILTNIGIANAGPTSIQGNIGTTPALQNSITGFSETMDASNSFAKSILVTGKVFAAGMAAPTPAKLTAAFHEMAVALDDAAGRTSPDFTDVGSGIIGNTILLPGLYNWTTSLAITDDITLNGGPYDIWILQVAGNLNLASAKTITLTGGAQANNVFWQVMGTTTLVENSNFQGIILAKQQIVLQDGATLTGRAFSQHGAISLNASTVNQP